MTTKKIPTSDIEIGMYVSRLDRPWRETPFLAHGFYVKNTDELRKLSESARFAYVMIPDEEYTLQSAHNKTMTLATINGLMSAANLKSHKPRVSFQDELPSAEKAHTAVVNLTMQIWRDLKSGGKLNMDEIDGCARTMVDSIERNPDAYSWLCCVKDYESATFRHAITVSGLLTVFGRQLELGRKELRLLAIGGICLDVGNNNLPEELLNKQTRLTDDEWETMKTHVRHSMQLINDSSDADERLLWMIATHHERYDGSGYLAGLSGDHIPLFGQMAGIVDSYLASTESKPYADAMTSDDAIETLYRQRGHQFKSTLVDHFIQAVGLYPTGSLVELNTGEVAIVVAQNAGNRLRPLVALILDTHKKPYQGYPLVNLATRGSTSNGVSQSIVKGLRAGQYPVVLENILGPVASHVPVDVEEWETDEEADVPRTHRPEVVGVKGVSTGQGPNTDTGLMSSNLNSTNAATAPPKPSRFIGTAAVIAAVVFGGAFIAYQHNQLQGLTQQLEESRQVMADKTDEVRLLAESEAKRTAIAELEAEQARLAVEVEARRKEVEEELKAVVEARRQAALEVERAAAAEAKRQAAWEAERAAAAEARRQAALEAERAATEARRQAALEAERAAAQARRQTALEAERAAVEARRRAALEAEIVAAAEERQAALNVEPASVTDVRHNDGASAAKKPGSVFRDQFKDGREGPEMVVIPEGVFRMGRLHGRGDADEKPVHTVRIATAFAMGRYEVTFDEYDQFARATGRTPPRDQGWGRGRNPVINVSWEDAVAYSQWLSKQTGQQYRLPTEAEWEYAARAGSEDVFAWGNDIEPNRANCNGCRSRWDGKRTSPVGSFQPNQFALYDTVGNVWEWVGDCWRPNYDDQATGTSGWLKVGGENCSRRIRRGGSWNDEPIYVRLANRGRGTPDYRNFNVGFRLVREL